MPKAQHVAVYWATSKFTISIDVVGDFQSLENTTDIINHKYLLLGHYLPNFADFGFIEMTSLKKNFQYTSQDYYVVLRLSSNETNSCYTK